jgi:hypothetical protein
MAIAQQGQTPNRQQPKKPGKNRFAHTPNTPYGMGDNYGQGVKNPVARIVDMSGGINPLPKSKLKKPPRNLA